MLTKARLDRLVALHRDGWTQREIGACMKIHQTTVGHWLHRLGLPANGWRTERSRRRRSEVSRLVWAIRRARAEVAKRQEGWRC